MAVHIVICSIHNVAFHLLKQIFWISGQFWCQRLIRTVLDMQLQLWDTQHMEVLIRLHSIILEQIRVLVLSIRVQEQHFHIIIKNGHGNIHLAMNK